MKIGIITFHTAQNYGAVLQAYGLQQTVKKLENNCEIIDYDCEKFKKDYAVLKFSLHIKRFFRSVAAVSITRELKKKYAAYVQHYLQCSKTVYTKQNIKECSNQDDLFITGSDQVWDPYCAGFDPNYFLEFVSDESKIASYAASFDKMEIPEELKEEFIRRVKRFKYISCREEAGASLVKQLTGRSVEVHVDPSFLLNADEWAQIAVKPQIESPYLFVYPVGQSQEMLEFAKKLAERKGLKVVYLVYNKPWNDNKVMFVTGAGPEEFLGYILHAKYVVTNAFHGTAFSLIFHKPFYSFCGKDGKGNTRIQTVLKASSLRNRIIDEKTLENQSDAINWTPFEDWTSSEREKTNSYLKRIIKGE